MESIILIGAAVVFVASDMIGGFLAWNINRVISKRWEK